VLCSSLCYFAGPFGRRKENAMINETQVVIETQVEELEKIEAPMIVWGD
jgi:hypothetical protein